MALLLFANLDAFFCTQSGEDWSWKNLEADFEPGSSGDVMRMLLFSFLLGYSVIAVGESGWKSLGWCAILGTFMGKSLILKSKTSFLQVGCTV